MKVLLVAINSKFIHSNLAVRYLKAYTEELDYESKIAEFSINDSIENIVERIIEEKPNVVTLSTYIWNVEYVRRVSNLIKIINPSIDIVYGGPEVSYDGAEFLRTSSGDYVIEGEGEETFREFILYKLGNMKIKDILGIYYRDNENIGYLGKRPLMNMDKIRFPYKEDEDLSNKIVYFESSRGCPFNCKYCLSSTTHGVRFLDLERVKKELKFFIDKKVRLVKFVDRTFNCNSKFAMGIWSFLIEQDTDTSFHFEISADLLKQEEIELLWTAPKGRFQFEVGVQTTNNDILRNINRYVNFEHIKEKVEELYKIKNIKQHLDLIAGLPGEDLISFKNSFNNVYSIKPEEIQLGFLKLLKGSSMRDEAEMWGMRYSPYPPYEILSTKDISYDELILLKKVEHMVDKYYNTGKFNNIINILVNKFNTPFEFYYELSVFFEKSGYFKRSLANNDYYRVFLDFNSEKNLVDEETLKDLLRYEYLNFNKKRGIPSFLYGNLKKEQEREIREKLKSENNPLMNSEIIEKFSFNIKKFLEEGILEKEDYYVIFRENEIEFL